MLILVLLVLGFVFLAGLGFWYAVGTTITDGRKQKAMEDRAEDILDDLFTDAGDQVVYRPEGRVGLSLETLVDGATIRGYRMVNQSGQLATWRVVFERAA